LEHYTKSLPYELELTSRILHEATVRFFEKNNFPISQEEFVILDCIYMNPDIIQMELSKLILKGRAHTGKFLKSLESKNLITRAPDKKNSAIVMKTKITREGLKLYKEISEKIDTFVKETSSISKDSIDKLTSLLHLIREDATSAFDIKFN